MQGSDKIITAGLLLFVSLCLGLLAFGGFESAKFALTPESLGALRIEVGGTPLIVDVARTKEARAQGLSGRERIPNDHGLLFIFEESGRYPIWMRNMKFPIDVYWIDESGVIVDVWENARPESYPSVFSPRADAKYILEVIAGYSEIFNVRIGTTVTGLPQ